MIKFFRFLILASSIVVAAAAVVPFGQPINVDVPLGGRLPTWFLGCLALLAAAAAGGIASVGLLLLRKWGRVIGVLAVAAALLGILVNLRSPIAASLSSASGVALVAGILAWSCGVAMAFHPSVASRLKA